MDVRCDSEACWRYAERGPWESHSSHVSRKQATLESDVAARVIAFIEGDVFKGSRLMPLEDLLSAMPDDYKIPGLPAAHSVAFKRALQRARTALVAPGPAVPSEAHVPVSPGPRHTVDHPPLPPAGSALVRCDFVSRYSLIPPASFGRLPPVAVRN